MKLSRKLAVKINFFLDQCIPPIVRDSKWFVIIPLKILFKDKAHIFMEFKSKAFEMTEIEFSEMYKEIEPVLLGERTDLNNACINEILNNIFGHSVLEVGCGKCFLAEKISERHQVTATDIVIDPQLINKYPNIYFKTANIEKMPFKDKEFDTVVCTHTLEHVRNIFQALKELRRVTKKRLIIVVPKQRPYYFTFNLHLHFFPYKHSLLAIMGNKNNSCKEIDGDFFYIEDYK